MYEHKVMNCNEFEDKHYKDGGCISPKPDGVRAFFIPGYKTLMSRSYKPIIGMDHIIQYMIRLEYPHVVDMELTIPGMEFNELSGLIRNHDSTPEAIGQVIDVPSIDGPLDQRLSNRPYIDVGAPIIQIPHYKIKTLEDLHRRHALNLQNRYEGSVFKLLDEPYTNSRKWFRLVPTKSEDLTCIGVYEGKGKFAGMLGGIVVKFGEFECKVGTMKGVTMEDRQDMWDNAHQVVGMTAEIQYKELTKYGKMRQPRFKGWRYDK